MHIIKSACTLGIFFPPSFLFRDSTLGTSDAGHTECPWGGPSSPAPVAFDSPCSSDEVKTVKDRDVFILPYSVTLWLNQNPS